MKLVFMVTNMLRMFSISPFNRNIYRWTVSNVTDMHWMFFNSKFSHDLANWKPKNLQSKDDMFNNLPFPKPYWYFAENTQQAIKAYEFQVKLENFLINKQNNKVKL